MLVLVLDIAVRIGIIYAHDFAHTMATGTDTRYVLLRTGE